MNLPSNIHQRVRYLKQNLRRGESSLSWIDFYAAEAAVQQLESSSVFSSLSESALGAIFDLTLLLSYASGLGRQCLSVDELSSYSHLCIFHRDQSLAESLHALPDAVLSNGEVRGCFVKRDNNIYLRRLWQLTSVTDTWLYKQLESESARNVSQGKLALHALFKDLEGAELDYQALAVAQSLLSNIVLVSGGPGTGKTTTAAKIILTRLSADIDGQETLSTVCLAPTGKAAQRLASSLSAQAESLLASLPFDDRVIQALRNALPKQGKTVHRYLIENDVSITDFADDVYLSDNERLFGKIESKDVPNVVVVDESSMIDLALMERLSTILHPQSCVVLLGDHYQLPAVEAGDVFAQWVTRFKGEALSEIQLDQLSNLLPFDLNAESASSSRINPLVTLQKSYRFHGALAELALIVRDDTPEAFRRFLKENKEGAVSYHWIEGRTQQELGALFDQYQGFIDLAQTKAPLAQLQQGFDQFQILCSTRLGPLGTDDINKTVNVKAQSQLGVNRVGIYHGMPIMLQRNYPKLDLYNGDVGFYIESSDGNGRSQFMAAFYRGGEGRDITVLPSQLDKADLAYAMTVHKSQGSEYDHVGVVLAPYAQELLTRALFYTGVTRAKCACSLYISQQSLEESLR